jgi:glyoxylate/hydroxypyruvate reductase
MPCMYALACPAVCSLSPCLLLAAFTSMWIVSFRIVIAYVCVQVDPVMSERMATWITWAVINSHRQMDSFAKYQVAKQWMQRGDFPSDNFEVTVTVLGGLGAMGLPAVRALSVLGYSVCTCSRTLEKVHKAGRMENVRHITFESLEEQLPKTDVLVCLLPLTESTKGLISKDLLKQLKPAATVVNAGRGAHVVEADLIDALESGALTPLQISNSWFHIMNHSDSSESNQFGTDATVL